LSATLLPDPDSPLTITRRIVKGRPDAGTLARDPHGSG